jgi:hypothetical protein
MIFQLDGTLAHWGLEVRAFLNQSLDRQRRAYTIATTTFSGHNSTLLFSMGLGEDTDIHISGQ